MHLSYVGVGRGLEDESKSLKSCRFPVNFHALVSIQGCRAPTPKEGLAPGFRVAMIYLILLIGGPMRVKKMRQRRD